MCCDKKAGGVRWILEVNLHSLMSGKYAQKRVIGSRTVCLNSHGGVSETNQAQALDEKVEEGVLALT